MKSELEKILKDKQEEFTERNLQLKEGVFTATSDPRRPLQPPPAEVVPPFMNFAPMKNAIELLKKSAERYSKALTDWRAKGSPVLSPQALETINADLLKVPRLFLNEKGLPERPWFKNQIYAPGAYTGYGAKPIAAVREYMDEKKWKEAEEQVPGVAKVIETLPPESTKRRMIWRARCRDSNGASGCGRVYSRLASGCCISCLDARKSDLPASRAHYLTSEYKFCLVFRR